MNEADSDRPADADVGGMEHLQRLLDIMALLRDPQRGCPWDQAQTFHSLIPHTLEEAYEVADAVERGDPEDLRDELGDLLLQVVFHARIAEESRLFDFGAVARAVADKLVRRHPHVFDGVEFADDRERQRYWETDKVEQRRRKSPDVSSPSVLDGVTGALPALMHAQKLQLRAARHGFDWSDAASVLDKLDEEVDELKTAVMNADAAEVREELGDLLFTVVNLARHLGVDAETALKSGSRKFDRRFRYIESQLASSGVRLDDVSLEILDRLWDQAKRSGL
ncbi:MAG: nucleoside triphosphate pyrophosphohydrolase [Methylotetracoccus sp.]